MESNYQDRIPNNVGLGSNRTLQRALEHWQPEFLNWWHGLGPSDFNASSVYLRTAISVDTKGWATFDYVRMPDYRWGIFLAQQEDDRRVGFGDHFGQPVWQQVPGEHRSTLRRLIVTQGDTEPASVEQQRLLGHTAPSLYDLRNLFQVNVEEGRHLWAMVYLLHAYFGRDGREEAEELLERHSGDADKPRILSTFNEPISDWLSFYMFTYFTDRDGKFQLKSLAESSFDPLDLFGGDSSSNAASYFANGLKGRPDEIKYEDHIEAESSYTLELPDGKGGIREERIPMRNAVNEVVREAYVRDCEKGMARWNRHLEEAGYPQRMTLPSTRFRRTVGSWANVPTNPEGKPVSAEEFNARQDEWLPTPDDRAYVHSVMRGVFERGKMAGWIAPPERGINTQPIDFEYIKFH